MISGISHITFMVQDLERASLFWQHVFAAREVYASGERSFSLAEEKFFLINDIWICLMRGEPPQERGYDHIAFQVPDNELEGCLARIREIGAEIRPGRPRVAGEGCSIYVYDFDRHLLELHTGTLTQRLERYAEDQ